MAVRVRHELRGSMTRHCARCLVSTLGERGVWGRVLQHSASRACSVHLQTSNQTRPCMRAGNYRNGAQYVGILFLTFWILLSYLVPLSLFVTMEIVKFVLARAVLPVHYPDRAAGKPDKQRPWPLD